MTGAKIIEIAEKYLGDDGKKFWNDYGLPAGSHWCCAFVWDIFRMAGASGLFFNGQKTAYVPTAQIWLHANCKKISMKNAKPGDIVVFTWSGNGYDQEIGSRDHIGFIRQKGTSKLCYTVEGNTGGSIPYKSKVMNRTREAKYIFGIYRPAYTHSNAWKLRRSAKKVVAYMKRHGFKYKGSWKDNSLTWAGAKKKKTTNCSTMVCYALQKAGFLKPGQYFWINGDNIVCKGGLTPKKLKKIAKILHPHKSPKNAHLHKGDICGYHNNAHTQIFAGFNKDRDPMWYSTGGLNDIKSGKAHVKKSYNTKRIDTIIRLK